MSIEPPSVTAYSKRSVYSLIALSKNSLKDKNKSIMITLGKISIFMSQNFELGFETI